MKRSTAMGRLLAGAAVALALAPGIARADVDVSRIAGANRYETMQRIVSSGFGQSDWAVIATGDNFPDALSASALAGVRECPIVLTSGGALSGEARATLVSLGARNAYVVGGTKSVSPSVEQEVRSLGISTERLAGADRVGTSLAVHSKINEVRPGASPYVIVATGSAFADSLSIAPFAWRSHAPIILAQGGGLTDAAVSAIRADGNITSVIIVGGQGAVSDRVRDQLGPGYEYVRLSGADRYETSAAVADFEARSGFSWSRPLVATGKSFPDALSGSALAGKGGSPLLLVSPSSDAAARAVAGRSGQVSGILVLGGESSVPQTVALKTAGRQEASGPSDGGMPDFSKYDAEISSRAKGSFQRGEVFDYEGNGAFGEFVLTGKGGNTSAHNGDEAFTDAQLWYVNESGEITLVHSFSGYCFVNGLMFDGDHTLYSLEQTAGGSGTGSRVFGVHDGTPVDLGVGGCLFQQIDGQIVGASSFFADGGGRRLSWYRYSLDPVSFKLVKGEFLKETGLFETP